MPHEVLIRYLTYWSEAIDSRKYVVESDLPHEEWYTDCCNYAASETDEERYMHAKCMTETLGHMLQDIKNNHNKCQNMTYSLQQELIIRAMTLSGSK